MQQKIIFATNNQHKLKEIQSLLGDQFLLVSLHDAGFSGDIPENQPTLQGNALEKARYIYDRFHTSCFADDTGLEVEALSGEPGVYSARYAGSLADFGSDEKRSQANMAKLLDKLGSQTNRSARFRTVIAFIHLGKEYFFEGIVEGSIIEHQKGTEGFGYDPIFVPHGYQHTFAEMPLSEKNKISHRARAFSKFIMFMKHFSEK
jgi:XTP/dITP diphosphohydrolase